MGTAEAVLVVIGSAVAVIGGLAALIRAVWKFGQDIRDNKRATMANTQAIGALSAKLDALAHRMDGTANPWRPRW